MPLLKPVLIPYKMSSKSAKGLSQCFTELLNKKIYRVSRESLTYRPRHNRLYINWGCSQPPIWNQHQLTTVNQYPFVGIASNKLLTFRRVGEQDETINIPRWTTDRDIAVSWLSNVCVRSYLSSHSGNGLSIWNPLDNLPLPNAPLYVEYIKKAKEFRVHVIFGEVVDVQQKKKSREIAPEQVNYQIRSHQNGWVFCREDVQEPVDLREQAIKVVQALGLNFGAVDIIWNSYQNKCYVLEVNTAPGLEGTTITKYANALLGKVQNV